MYDAAGDSNVIGQSAAQLYACVQNGSFLALDSVGRRSAGFLDIRTLKKSHFDTTSHDPSTTKA